MACSNCSKIRCKLFGIIAGAKTEFVVKDFCGSLGEACKVTNKDGDTYQRSFGNDWDSFPSYLRLLKSAFKNRLSGRMYRG